MGMFPLKYIKQSHLCPFTIHFHPADWPKNRKRRQVSNALHSQTAISGIPPVCYRLKIIPVCFTGEWSLCPWPPPESQLTSAHNKAHALLPFFLLLSFFVWLISSPRLNLSLKEKWSTDKNGRTAASRQFTRCLSLHLPSRDFKAIKKNKHSSIWNTFVLSAPSMIALTTADSAPFIKRRYRDLLSSQWPAESLNLAVDLQRVVGMVVPSVLSHLRQMRLFL